MTGSGGGGLQPEEWSIPNEDQSNQLEINIRLKQSEIKILLNELETLHQMMNQLENQKSEAKKRLQDMSSQVESLRTQTDQYKESIETQENEINAKKRELDELKSEENQMQNKLSEVKKSVDAISRELADNAITMSQYKLKLVNLEEYENRLETSNSELESAIIKEDIDKLNGILARPITPISELISEFPEIKDDLESGSFMDKDAGFMSFGNEFQHDPFAGEDLFNEDDPFKKDVSSSDNFFANDNFSSPTDSGIKSAFDPFSNPQINNRKDSNVDLFGADPFSLSPRSSSPAPELPPKKCKAPPPRPAPPKPGTKPPPPRPAPPSESFKKAVDPWGASADDPFSASTTASVDNFDAFGSNFADFSAFERK